MYPRDMGRPFALLLGLMLPVLSPAQPYSLRADLDIPMIAGLWVLKRHSSLTLAETRENGLDVQALDRRDVPVFDRWVIGQYSPGLSAFSSVVAWSQLALPVAVNLWDTHHGKQPWYGILTDVILLQEASLISSSLSSYAKSVPLHSTPLTYDPAVPVSEKRVPQNVSSFFSNHTASAFTTAVYSAYTFQLRHPESPLVPWVWSGSMAAAAGVGSLRILSGKHFPSDVLAGAAVGALCGYLIPAMHTRNALGRGSPESGRAPENGWLKLNWRLGVTFPEGTQTAAPTLLVDF